jgi:hypothetical protein
MDIGYLLNDYRINEGKGWKEPTSYGVKIPSWEQPVKKFTYEFDINATDADGVSHYWIIEDGERICPIVASYGSGTDERPMPKTFHHAGKAFVVQYYHDGGICSIREIDS